MTPLTKQEYRTKDVFRLSVPIFVELLLQLLVGNVDQMMVSRYSQSAVAAIGNGNQLMNIVIILLSVMAGATTVVLSQRIGAKDTKRITQLCALSTLVMLVNGLIATAILVGANRPIFALLSVPGDVLGPDNLFALERPLMGSEDFAFFLEKIPAGGIFRLGLGTAPGRILHNPRFDFPDEALAKGVAAMTAFALRQCQ